MGDVIFQVTKHSCTFLTFQVQILISLTMSDFLNGSPKSVAILSVYQQANMMPGSIGWRKPPFYFCLSTEFLHSTHSYSPAPGIRLAAHLCKCNTTSVFPGGRPTARLLLCSGMSSRLRARAINSIFRVSKISTWPQVATGTRAFWATNNSRGKSCSPAVLSTFTSLYSLHNLKMKMY